MPSRLDAARTWLPPWRFEAERARQQILAFFGWTHLEGVGLDPYPAAIGALGALLDQVETTQKGRPAHIQGVSLEQGAVGPLLDATSAKHLEIFANTLDGTKAGSLLQLLDACRTRMGSRLLKAWLDQPLREQAGPRAAAGPRWPGSRRTAAGSPSRSFWRRCRTSTACWAGWPWASPRRPELGQLREGLAQLQRLPALIAEGGWFQEAQELELWPEGTPLCADLLAELQRCLAEAPPLELEKGGTIREGVDPELDAVRRLARDAKQVMLELEEEERAASGIGSLKIKYNRVFGYYFEITKSNLGRGPGPLHPQADPGQRRALHHREADGLRAAAALRGDATSCGWRRPSSGASWPWCWSTGRRSRGWPRPWRGWTCWRPWRSGPASPAG